MALLLLMPLCVSCKERKEDEEIKIVCTVFPLYEWVRNVVGDAPGVEVVWLCDNGADPHSFQPSAKHMAELASSDLTVYVGGVSDAWIEEALNHAVPSAGLPLIDVEGMTVRCVSDQSGHAPGDGHAHETDEHLWLSLRNASISVDAITGRLCALDEAQAEIFRANAEAYKKQLEALNRRYAEAVNSVEHPRLVCADRFPFVYLMEDYGIEYRAAFGGCTTDLDADFSVVVGLAEQIHAWRLRYILVTETANADFAESIKQATVCKDQEIVAMDSLQAVNRRRMEESGVTYLSVMEENLTILTRILEIKE